MCDKTCRLCLNDDSLSLNLFSEESRNRDVLHKIKFCIPVVKISKNDSNPRHICFKCLGTLETVSEFMKKCVASESILSRSSQSPANDIMNLSVCSSHYQTGKHSRRQSKAEKSVALTSSSESTPERAVWGRGNEETPCCKKLECSGGGGAAAATQGSAVKKRKIDTLRPLPHRTTPPSFIRPSTFGGAGHDQVGRKPPEASSASQQERTPTTTTQNIFAQFNQIDQDDDDEDCEKFLGNLWKDKGAPATQPAKDCRFQGPNSDTNLTAGSKTTSLLGHIVDNWKPNNGDKASCGLNRSQITQCVNN